MPKKCSIPNCKIQSDDKRGLSLSFFTVPTDEKTKKKWIEILRNIGIEVKKYTYVCSLHFEEQYYHYSGLCKTLRLVKGAYPTVFSNYKFNDEKVIEFKEEADISEEVQQSVEEKNVCNRNASTWEVPSENSLFISTFFKVVDVSSESSDRRKDFDQTDTNLNCVYKEASNDVKPEKSMEVYSTSISNAKQKQATHISIANINLDSIDYSIDNMYKIKDILANAKKEVITLHRKIRSLQMKLYRSRKKGVKDLDTLVKHVKRRKYINEKASKMLSVSISEK